MKEVGTELRVPLSKIFSKSHDEGKLPEVWKRAIITPIHKKGDRTSPSNYRPVSLTSIVSKVLESIVRKLMLDHLFNNNLITNHQHGFLPCRSCTTQLLTAIEDGVEILDGGDSVDDFKKRLTQYYMRECQKLRCCGYRGKLLNWIQAFIKGHRQRVRVGGSLSPWSDVLNGIPQGSALGLLFLCHLYK